MGAVRLTTIGCSGSFPGPDSPASCYLLAAEGFHLVLDLGNGALGALQHHVDLDDVDAVCLSHLHADHCLDMCCYDVVRRYAAGGPRPPLPVYAPAGAAERIARATDAGAQPRAGADSDVFDYVTLREGRRRIGPFLVTARQVDHPVPTFGFRIEHNGAAVAYSADTGECEALVPLARDADLLLCEASFLDGPDLPPGLHLTGRQAGGYAARANVGQLVLTHLVPWHDPARSLAEARASFDGQVSLAASGRSFDLD